MLELINSTLSDDVSCTTGISVVFGHCCNLMLKKQSEATEGSAFGYRSLKMLHMRRETPKTSKRNLCYITANYLQTSDEERR